MLPNPYMFRTCNNPSIVSYIYYLHDYAHTSDLASHTVSGVVCFQQSSHRREDTILVDNLLQRNGQVEVVLEEQHVRDSFVGGSVGINCCRIEWPLGKRGWGEGRGGEVGEQSNAQSPHTEPGLVCGYPLKSHQVVVVHGPGGCCSDQQREPAQGGSGDSPCA